MRIGICIHTLLHFLPQKAQQAEQHPNNQQQFGQLGDLWKQVSKPFPKMMSLDLDAENTLDQVYH